MEKRAGRIIRCGNNNDEVHLYRYVTEGAFDAYLHQLVETKQRFISQIMTSKTPVRIAEDTDGAAHSYAELKMLAIGNPKIKEKMDLDLEISRLKLLKANHLSQKCELEDNIRKHYPNEIQSTQERIAGYEKYIHLLSENTVTNEGGFMEAFFSCFKKEERFELEYGK